MKYLVRSAMGLVAYVVIALMIHFFTYTSSMKFAEYRGLIASLPNRLGESSSQYDLQRLQQTLMSLSIGADVGLSFDSKPLYSYLGEDKFDLNSTIELLEEGRIQPAKLKLELLLVKVDRAFQKQLKIYKYLAYLGLALFCIIMLVLLIMIRRSKLAWQLEIAPIDIEHESFASELSAHLQAVVQEEVKFTGNRAEINCVGFDLVPEKLEEIVQMVAENFVRNSVEHGGSKPEQRLLLGKTDFISIRVSFLDKNDHYFLSVWDNGNGLDLTSIVNQCIERGVITNDEAATMSELQKSSLIFLEAGSSRNKANSIAETDIPLQTIKQLVGPFLAVFSVLNKPNQSFLISLKIPK